MNQNLEPSVTKELIESFGWLSVYSKNPLMKSFIKGDVRLNYYFTTGTITFQSKGEPCETYRDLTMLELENILNEI